MFLCKPSYAEQKTAPPITVWIHGTKVQPHVPVPLTAIQPLALYLFTFCMTGLHKATALANEFHHHQIATTLAACQPEAFSLDTFYLFGWSGKLDPEERLRAASDLYIQLQPVIQEYEKTWKQKPFIRIISHSHGGNVALNLARIQKQYEQGLNVDELILLACPVQKETSHFITDTMFKKIYSFYSSNDLIQRADPQVWPLIHKKINACIENKTLSSLCDIFDIIEDNVVFSERIFSPYPTLTQIELKFGNRSIMHIEFKLLHIVRQLPTILNRLASLQALHPNQNNYTARIETDGIYIISQ